MSYESPHTPESAKESFPRISEAMVANMLQLRLMPLAFQLRHPDIQVNMADKELREQVGQEWVSIYAKTFREYIEDHPRETIDLGSDEALLEFLQQLEPQTLH